EVRQRHLERRSPLALRVAVVDAVSEEADGRELLGGAPQREVVGETEQAAREARRQESRRAPRRRLRALGVADVACSDGAVPAAQVGREERCEYGDRERGDSETDAH